MTQLQLDPTLEPSDPPLGTGCQECGNDEASVVLGKGTPAELALCSDCLHTASYAGGEAPHDDDGTTTEERTT